MQPAVVLYGARKGIYEFSVANFMLRAVPASTQPRPRIQLNVVGLLLQSVQARYRAEMRFTSTATLISLGKRVFTPSAFFPGSILPPTSVPISIVMKQMYDFRLYPAGHEADI
jgi:hypothetical protein